MHTFSQYLWSDSSIEKLEITSERVCISVVFDDGTPIDIVCRNVVAVDHLCMWEDTIIHQATVSKVSDLQHPFLKEIASKHPFYDCAENNPVRNGLLDLAIELVNHITCHIYCHDIQLNQSI